jgi:hypothetical protein
MVDLVGTRAPAYGGCLGMTESVLARLQPRKDRVHIIAGVTRQTACQGFRQDACSLFSGQGFKKKPAAKQMPCAARLQKYAKQVAQKVHGGMD